MVRRILDFLLAGFMIAASAPAQSVFISEYVEGTSLNRGIEVYNPSGVAIDLAAEAFVLRIYANGSSSVSASINLTGVVAANDVYVLAHSDAVFAADQKSSGVNFNGDDALVLEASGLIVDSIGRVGEDPGNGWGSGSTTTDNHTLRRDTSVCGGDTNTTDQYDPVTEWLAFDVDTYDGLGSHAADCSAPTPPTEVVATSGFNAAYLAWSAGLRASSYNVKRSLTSGGPYTTIASGIQTEMFTDEAVERGTEYVYVVSSVNGSGEADSSEVRLIAGVVDVVISEVYGGGGHAGASYTHDFIEIFNRGTQTVSLDYWSVQYAPYDGTAWGVTPLLGRTLAPGAYLLIQETSSGSDGMPLPTPDVVGSEPMSATRGKVILAATTNPLSGSDPRTTSTAVIDFVGYGEADAYETSPASAPSSSLSVSRTRCVDTDDNSADFTVEAPNPLNNATTPQPCIPNNAPAIELSATSPQTVAEGSMITFDVIGTDEDGDPLTFEFTGLSTSPDVPTLTGEGNSRTFSWTPGFSRAPGPYEVTFTVSDASESAQTVMTIHVADTAIPPPDGVVATAKTSTSVEISWNHISGAVGYEVVRFSSGGSSTVVGSPSTSPFTEMTASENTSYLYAVRALDADGYSSGDSVGDLATTVIFTDDVIGVGSTPVRAIHFEQLRVAIDAVRQLAGLDPATITEGTSAGTTVKKMHVDELRAALEPARGELGLSTGDYTDATIVANGTVIKASHVNELRDGVR